MPWRHTGEAEVLLQSGIWKVPKSRWQINRVSEHFRDIRQKKEQWLGPNTVLTPADSHLNPNKHLYWPFQNHQGSYQNSSPPQCTMRKQTNCMKSGFTPFCLTLLLNNMVPSDCQHNAPHSHPHSHWRTYIHWSTSSFYLALTLKMVTTMYTITLEQHQCTSSTAKPQKPKLQTHQVWETLSQ
jgi:hypothetical protein